MDDMDDMDDMDEVDGRGLLISGRPRFQIKITIKMRESCNLGV